MIPFADSPLQLPVPSPRRRTSRPQAPRAQRRGFNRRPSGAGTPAAGTAASAQPAPHPGHAHVMADRAWLVLARRSYEEPLHQVGIVTADDEELARVYARSIYDEFAWVEMAVVPRDALVTVIAS